MCHTRTLIVAAALAAMLAAGARAAELIPLEDECNGRQLMIKGLIEPGDYERFADRLARLVTGGELPAVQDPDVLWTVKLDSAGGDVAEAMRIGRLLRRVLATTEASYRYARRPDGVYDFERGGEVVCLNGDGRLSGCHRDLVEAECTGACLLIWLAGAERHANEGRLGLHGLSGSESPEVREYLAEMGVSAPWVQRMTADEPAADGWLSWPERRELSGRARVLTERLAGCPDPLTRDEAYRSVTSPDEAQRNRLMDRADAHRSCRRGRVAEARAPVVAWLGARLAGGAVAGGAVPLE